MGQLRVARIKARQMRDTMGDSQEGSSTAAQRAPEPSEPQPAQDSGSGQEQHSERGFFSRLVEAFSPSDPDRVENGATSEATPAASMPGMVNLRRMRVEDVMIPSAEITAVPVTIDLEAMIEAFRDSGFTRMPVFDGTLDTPLGFVNLKDLALTHGFNGGGPDYDLPALVRPLIYVPPSMPLGVLLQKMQAERIHMALVIDEYGGTDGLVTIEDLLEQVVGEIEDEHDSDADALWVAEGPGQYLAEARTPLEDFEEEIGTPLTRHEEIDEEEIDTLGGLVFMLAGQVPARGEVIEHPDGPEFEVVEADPRRIKRLRVRLKGDQDG